MAEIRFNYNEKFAQSSTNSGIGSATPEAKLDVIGNTSAESLRVSGIATLSSYQGFVNTKLTTNTDDLIVESGQSGSVSGEVLVSTGQTISVSTGATTGQGGIQSLKVYETFMPPVGRTADRPTDVKPGMVYYNKDFKTIEFWDGNFWKQVDNTTRRGRGVVSGGRDSNLQMQFINIASKGNSQSFGVHTGTTSTFEGFGLASETRGIFAGTYPGQEDIIEYITIASEGNSIDFGNLTDGRRSGAGASSSTRGLFAGGISPSDVNIIDYIEIATIGNALDFGDLNNAGSEMCGFSDPVRSIFSGGDGGPNHDIQFVITSSKGNAVKTGDLTRTVKNQPGASNQVRGLVMGGYEPTRTTHIDAVSMASMGNAVMFGDLTQPRGYNAAVASQTRACSLGGNASPIATNSLVIDFVEIATFGNAQDFGDMTIPTRVIHGASDSHGGLGGF